MDLYETKQVSLNLLRSLYSGTNFDVNGHKVLKTVTMSVVVF
jgi:hypothetical protein